RGQRPLRHRRRSARRPDRVVARRRAQRRQRLERRSARARADPEPAIARRRRALLPVGLVVARERAVRPVAVRPRVVEGPRLHDSPVTARRGARRAPVLAFVLSIRRAAMRSTSRAAAVALVLAPLAASALGQTPPTFTSIPALSGVQVVSTSLADLDADGDLDL